jgi:hypothetical protein
MAVAFTSNLNANTEAVARAIWSKIQNKTNIKNAPNNLKNLWTLKSRVNHNVKPNTTNKYYKLNAPKTGGFFSGLFSSKTPAKSVVNKPPANVFHNAKSNAFKVKTNAKPRRFGFFRRFGRTKTPPSAAVTKTAVQQANTTVSVWNKLASETSNTAQKANASFLAANKAAVEAKEAAKAAKEVAKQPGAPTAVKVAANAKAYKAEKAEKAAKLAKEQLNQAAKNAEEAAKRLNEAKSNKNKTAMAAAALTTATKAEQNVKEKPVGQKAAAEAVNAKARTAQAAAQLAQSTNQGKINAQKAVALAKANEGIKASVMNTNKKILQFIRNDWWPTTNGKFQNKNKTVWKARRNNKKNDLRKNLEAKLKKINSSLTFNNVTAARVNKALESREIGWKKFLRRYNNNKQQHRNWGLNLIRPKN